MNLPAKAALLNALLFPGWGEIYLKRYKRGMFIIVSVTAGILSIVWSIIQATMTILKIAPFPKGSVTLHAVVELAISAMKALNVYDIFPLIASLVALWVISIIDAYLLGKQALAKATNARQQSASPPV